MPVQTKNNSDEQEKPKKLSKSYRILKGMRDVLADQQHYWEYVKRQASAYAASYGYDRIDLPIIEAETLFTKTMGKNTDVIEKELFTFQDVTGDKVALRPEGTASAARAYIEHALYLQQQPVKLFYEGPMFRRERPQGRRYSQFHQIGLETIGSNDPLVDAQTIFVAYKYLLSMGLPTTVQINSIGTEECRGQYKKELSAYFRTKRSELTEEARKWVTKHPLKILTSRAPELQPILEAAPQMVEYLDADCQQHFMKVLEYLDELDVPYFLNHTIVHDLDYYTHTVFEMHLETEAEEKSKPLAVGGRYDNMVEQIGGPEAGACGAAVYVERVINALKIQESTIPQIQECDIFVAQLGEDAKKKSMVLFEQLRSAGFCVAENLAKEGLRGQLDAATTLGVKYALILGQKEIMDGTIMVRDMENGIQEIVDFQKVVLELEKRLSKQLTVISSSAS